MAGDHGLCRARWGAHGGRLHDRAGRGDLRRALRRGRLQALGRLSGVRRKPGARHTDDVRLDDDVVRAADKKEMFDIVAPEQDQLPVAIEVVDIHDPEPGLACPAAIARQSQPPSRQAPQHQRKQRQQHEDDRERDQVPHRWRQILDARN
jgi:hypothetical protein